jgi:hypothetical protein
MTKAELVELVIVGQCGLEMMEEINRELKIEKENFKAASLEVARLRLTIAEIQKDIYLDDLDNRLGFPREG